MDEAELQISDLEDKIMETNEAEKKKRETKAREHDTRLRELSDLLKGITSESEESQKMKREKKGQKVYVSKLQQKTFLIWEKTQTSKSGKHRERPPLDSTKPNHQQGIS